jgi:hypothetical protein
LLSFGAEIFVFQLVYQKYKDSDLFGPKRDEVTGERRKVHNQELYEPYCSQNIVRAIKSRSVRWVGHVARMEDRRDA